MLDSTRTKTLEIYLFGKFLVKTGGAAIEENRWRRRAASHILKLLALQTDRQLCREQIIDFLWAEQDVKTSVNNLDKAIYELRRVLEPDLKKASESKFILTQKHQVLLRAPGKLFIDIAEFERAAREGIKTNDIMLCQTALDLYKSDLLTEDIYEDWAAAKREHLRILHRELTIKSAELYVNRNLYEKSIELLKRLSLIDSSDEVIHQKLMVLYAESGNKAQAIKQFEICRKALAAWNIDPEDQTLEIKRLIQTGKIKASAQKFGANFNAFQPAIQPRMRQLTFNRGAIQSAKFTSGGNNIVYSAAWEGNTYQIYKIHTEIFESVPTEQKNAGIFAVSPSDDVALSLNRRFLRGYISTGTLAKQHLIGGAPRELLADVQWADWHPDKKSFAHRADNQRLAVVRDAEGNNWLEYPIGNVLYKTGGWISHIRFSANGKLIAFIDHPTLGDDSGAVAVINLKGEKKTLSCGWISAQGLAWNGCGFGQEIWFTAAKEGNARTIYAVDLDGNERLVYQGIGSLTLHDLSSDNTALVTVDKTRIGIHARTAGEAEEKNLSWHDWSLVRDLSFDGETMLFTEAGESGGALYAAYLRRTDGSAALRLGSGSALALSPDGKFALVRLLTSPQRLALLPIGAGEPKILKPYRAPSFFYQPWACWFPDGKKILFAANEAASGTKLFVQDLVGEPVCLTGELEGIEISTPHAISPNGQSIAIINSDQRVYLYPVEGGIPQPLRRLEEPNFQPVAWSADGEYLFLRERGKVPAEIFRYRLSNGERQPLLTLMPKDAVGVQEILRILLARDGLSYAYSFTRELSDLFIIENLS